MPHGPSYLPYLTIKIKRYGGRSTLPRAGCTGSSRATCVITGLPIVPTDGDFHAQNLGKLARATTKISDILATDRALTG
jgi:hypothetical protein